MGGRARDCVLKGGVITSGIDGTDYAPVMPLCAGRGAGAPNALMTGAWAASAQNRKFAAAGIIDKKSGMPAGCPPEARTSFHSERRAEWPVN